MAQAGMSSSKARGGVGNTDRCARIGGFSEKEKKNTLALLRRDQPDCAGFQDVVGLNRRN